MPPYSATRQPKSMQQIAVLIILYAVHVAGIRNGGSTASQNAAAYVDVMENKFQSHNSNRFFPSQPLTEMPETRHTQLARQASDFQPLQIIDFTLDDASPVRQPYPPSYADGSYQAGMKLQEYAAEKYAMEKAFTFPNEVRDEQQYYGTPSQPSSYPSHSSYYERPSEGAQTKPIVTYLDPYTNENYHYTPTPIITAGAGAAAHRPQEYTVQSSMLVGHNQLQSGQFQRPGYVFDEQLGVSSKYRPTAGATSAYQREDVSKPATTAAGEKISYDSHDYPPPSYSQLQTSNFVQVPQRQEVQRPRPTPPPAPHYQSYPQQHQQQQRPTQFYAQPVARPQPPPPTPPPNYQQDFVYRPLSGAGGRPTYSNYYEYQLGEVPPQVARPQPPAGGGLATLASLFGTNSPTPPQQYAPQFASNPIGSILGAFAAGLPGAGQTQGGQFGGAGGGVGNGAAGIRPLNTQLIRALENIARNDDLQCVPKVLCQMIAAQTQRGQLPNFITSPTLTNFLAGFPAASPALIYGRAALLGISGGESSCTQTYKQCPKNEYEILYYLNNHRGGFFKFFSEPEEQMPQRPNSDTYGGGGGNASNGGGAASLFSILAALTGSPAPTPTTTTPRPRPTAPPQQATTDITSGIGNFFTNLLSEYVGGASVEYQRRRKRNKRSPLRFSEEQSADAEQELQSARKSKPLKFTEDAPELMRMPDAQSARQGKPLKFTDDSLELDSEYMLSSAELDEDFHDEEDDEDTLTDKQISFSDAESEEQEKTATAASRPIAFESAELLATQLEPAAVQFPDVAERILNKNAPLAEESHNFFPASTRERRAGERQLRALVEAFNRLQAERKLKFPSNTDERLYVEAEHPKAGKALSLDEQHDAAVRVVDSNALDGERESKKIVFAGDEENLRYLYVQPSGKIVFPEQSLMHIRKGRILNRPTYASGYEQYMPDKSAAAGSFVVFEANHRRPHQQTHANVNNYNNIVQQQIQSNTLHNYVMQSNYFNDKQQQQQQQQQQAQSNSYAHNGGGSNYSNKYGHYANAYNRQYYMSPATATATTTNGNAQRPYRKYEDDKNVYVTNGQGVTEYYITPDGRKIYIQ